jgi:2-pyrone-4,6-dicarboxylate lactonase
MNDAMDIVEPRAASIPHHALPPGSCDAHAHIFGPFDRFPPAGATAYAPPQAPFGRYRRMLETVGTTRGVVVQPTLYGVDPSALIDALRQGRGWIRGIGVATSDVSDAGLDEMHAAGVRGLRFIEMRDPRGAGRYGGGVGVEELWPLAPRMHERGWHAQIWAPLEEHVSLLPSLVRLGIPIVLDHMGMVTVERGAHDPAFRRILAHLTAGEIWVKLPLCRNSRAFPDYPDLRAFHDALVAANARQLLWGSDWPHVRMGDQSPDVGHLLDLFFAWVDDPATRHRILVDNPQELFGFDALRPPAVGRADDTP